MKQLIESPPYFDVWLNPNQPRGPYQAAVLAGSTFTSVNIGSPMATTRTMAIVPPLTVTEDSWVEITWEDGAETATVAIIGHAG